jgi:nucleoside-diphosphate-sugar epimerase
MHVQDVAAGFVALLDSSVVGSVNVGSGEAVAVRRLIELVATAAGRPDLVQLGALPRPPGDPESIVANIDRLTGEVGFRPRISLQSGVTETVEWWRGTGLEERES